MLDFDLQLDKVEEVYQKARFILEVLGEKEGHRVEYYGDRIRISGYASNALTVIYFDNRENTGEAYWGECLNVSSLGTIEYLSTPHLSEKESGKGCRNDVYLPWVNWLNKAHQIAKQKHETSVNLLLSSR